MTEHDEVHQIADAVASAIAILAAVSQPKAVAVDFQKHIKALAKTSPGQNAKGRVLDMIVDRLGALID